MSKTKNISERLLEARTALGLSQEQMAAKLGCSRNYVSMIEGGREPSKSLILLLEGIEKQNGGPSTDSVGSRETSTRGGRLSDEAHSGYSASRLTGRELLKSARKKKELSQGQLAKQVGYSLGVYQQIEDGGSQMSEKMAAKVAKVLDVDAEDLLGGGDHPPDNGVMHGTFGGTPNVALGPGMEQSKVKFVPLLSLAQCGSGAAWNSDGYAKEGFLSFDPKDKDAFAVTLAGDSMTPVYSPGDVALVYPNHQPRNGDLVIAVLGEEAGSDVMFKIFSTSGARVTLSSYNPAYPPMEFPRAAFRSLYPVAAVTKVLRRNGN